MRTQSKHIQTALRLASDWLREWCGFSRPITEQSKQLQCTLRLFSTVHWKFLSYIYSEVWSPRWCYSWKELLLFISFNGRVVNCHDLDDMMDVCCRSFKLIAWNDFMVEIHRNDNWIPTWLFPFKSWKDALQQSSCGIIPQWPLWFSLFSYHH